MKARYYGKIAKRYIYKTYKSMASFRRSQRGLRKRGIYLQPLPRKRKIRFARRWR